jgi:GT2 family glycosyltransferase
MKMPEEIRDQMDHPLVCAVVVNWNGKDYLLRCLQSMEKVHYPPERLQILVVDNASQDGSVQAARAAFPSVMILQNTMNRGYCTAVNQGITWALEQGASYVWVCNNDIRVDPGCLMRLVESGEGHPEGGVFGPLVYSYDEPAHVTNTGYHINFWTGQMRSLIPGRDIFVESESCLEEVMTVLGCAILIRAKVFHEVGLFNPVYGLYFEETDFNVRVRRGGGKVFLVKDAVVYHRNAGTMDRYLFRRAWLLLRNLFLFEWLHASGAQLLIFVPYFLLIHLPSFLVRGGCYAWQVKLRQRRESSKAKMQEKIDAL